MTALNKSVQLLGISAVLLTGCGGLPDPEKVGVAMQPKTVPTRNLTSFSQALSCMDSLFITHNKRGYTLTSTNLTDSTGKLSVGTKDMLLTAISTMSANSNALRYIDLDMSSGQDSVNVLTDKMKADNSFKSEMPTVYLRGSITQLDDNLMAGKQAMSFNWSRETGLDLGGARSRSVSAVTLDLNLMDLTSRTSMPGLHASNTLAVTRQGKESDSGIPGGKILKAGIQFNTGADSVESSGQAVRTLVQLGLIELMGKWTKVPYWNCLEIEGNNPAVRTQLQDWYDAMPPGERVRFIQTALKENGAYSGPVDGQQTDLLRSSIARYQANNDIIPNGNVSFEVYEALMQGKNNASAPAKSSETSAATSALTVNLHSTDFRTVFKKGEHLELQFTLSQAGYPRCFYQDSDGVVAQIYPNITQSDKKVTANQNITIPPKRDPAHKSKGKFTITFGKSNSEEEVLCLATETDMESHLPATLRVKALTPIKISNLDDIATIFDEQSNQNALPKPSIGRLKVVVQ